MTITQKSLSNNIKLLRVDGRLDQALTPLLESKLEQLLQHSELKIIVDLSETNYINSGGLRCLVTAWRKSKQQQGNLVLAGLNERLQNIFDMVGFDKVFTIFPDLETAVKSQQNSS